MLFTMHGTTMIFLVVMPLLFGFANYFVPLHDRGAGHGVSAAQCLFSFWLVPFGGILLHFSVLAGGAPAVGWFAYAPLNETPYSSLLGVDYWAVALLVLGIGSVGTAINLIVTVLCLRAPGMTLRRLPLFTWINFINSFLVLLAIPVLNAALVMLLIDRRLNGHFFLPSRMATAARRSCGSISFGRSAIRRCTSWRCRRLGSCRKSSRSFRANRSSAMNSSRDRRWRSRC
jgi:heme/copper-type cytochrome/quinol oxidase subunit 1